MAGLETPKSIQRLGKVTHSIRSAQAVLQYGVGAMVDFPDQTLMTAAPEFWADKVVKIHDERFEKRLNVHFFGMPAETTSNRYEHGIAFVRFPEWYFCPTCRKFQPISEWVTAYRNEATPKQKENNPYMREPKCMLCRRELVPARIVVACERGHIDDFPWVRWTHDNSMGKNDRILSCRNPMLRINTGASTSAGLEGIVLKCISCNASTSLRGAFDKDKMSEMEKKYGNAYACSGNLPWKNKRQACESPLKVVQRGASSVYYPQVQSSLVIPPYAGKLNVLVEGSVQFDKIISGFDDIDPKDIPKHIARNIDKWSDQISREILKPSESVKEFLLRRFDDSDVSASIDVEDEANTKFRFEEYEALSGKSQAIEQEDFVREEMDIVKYDLFGLVQVALLHKVREVRALTGFSRINPPSSTTRGDGNTVCVKESETRWYPGYEVRGEGIFLDFDGQMIDSWADNNPEITRRVEQVQKSYDNSYYGQFYARIITPRFLLLHSLAHTIIEQLSFECGYTSASLRERIFCEEGNLNMSAVFIYTAGGDSEGTLGGLARQGQSDCFPSILHNALEKIRFCSNDPVCHTSKGQGRGALNLAACHGCLLLPETSCEEYNVFLDRAFLIGTFDNLECGFFSKWLNQ